jgi:hypothetical protein
MIEISVQDKTPELMQKLQKAAGRFVRKGALHIEASMKISMADQKTGNSYKRGAKAIHVASAPGESPADDSSNYINSITISPEAAIIERTLEARIGTVVGYAAVLEEGTTIAGRARNTTIEPRPMWEKIPLEEMPTLEALLEAEIRAV